MGNMGIMCLAEPSEKTNTAIKSSSDFQVPHDYRRVLFHTRGKFQHAPFSTLSTNSIQFL